VIFDRAGLMRQKEDAADAAARSSRSRRREDGAHGQA
jgi:hypothetical protein